MEKMAIPIQHLLASGKLGSIPTRGQFNRER